MRDLIDLFTLNEAKIPDTPYGYWVLPDGSIHVVTDHESLVGSMLGYDSHKSKAVGHEGWIRLRKSSALPILYVEIGPIATKKALRSLQQIIAQYFSNDYEEVDIEIVDKNYRPIKHKLCRDKISASLFIDDNVNFSENLREGKIPETEYGYWVLPDGSIHVVKNFAHEDLAKELLGTDYTRVAIVIHGWVRIASYKKGVQIQLRPEQTSRALDTTYKAISKLYKDGCNQIAVEIDSSVQTLWKTKRFENKLDGINFIINSTSISSDMQKEVSLVEGKVPETEYGYWVLPDGSIHVVGYQDHDYVLSKITGKNNIHKYAVVNEMGWVRFGNAHGTDLSILIGSKVTSKAMKSTIEVISACAKRSSIKFDIEVLPMSKNLGIFAENRLQAIKFLKEHVKIDDTLTEAATSVHPYGYWILPDGSIHEVDYQNHGQLVKDTMGNDKNRYDGISEGWVRIVAPSSTDYPNFNIEIGKTISFATMRSLIKLTNQFFKEETMTATIDLVSRSWSSLGHKTFGNRIDTLNYLHENITIEHSLFKKVA